MSHYEPTSPTTPTPATPVHPFANTKNLLTVIRDEHVDLQAEAEFLADFEDDDTVDSRSIPPSHRSVDARSTISHEIWLDDQTTGLASYTFARDAIISGWTCVGDHRAGAYIVYDCVITTKEGTTIHALRRYNDFVTLRHMLMRGLLPKQRGYVPPLPPKSPLARYRPVFLDKRRLALQHWLRTVILHPEIGGCQPLRQWVMQ
ncbi:Phox-like protein [Serendipita vermifera]|nr:Phox-like protein [Serendipita vermifera]